MEVQRSVGGLVNLNLGCGEFPAPLPWINLDRGDEGPKPDVVCDFRDGIPYPNGSVARVYCGHVLEHLCLPDEFNCLVGEIGRVLAPGGVLGVVGPDVGRAVRLKFDAEIVHGAKFGAHRWPGDEHQWLSTGKRTASLLRGLGWSVRTFPVEEMPDLWPVTSRAGWQFALEASRV